MAGYYLLRSITFSDLMTALEKLSATWSDLQHSDVGWTPKSYQVLTTALKGQDIGNRDNLPPHRYLQIKGENPLADKKKQYLRAAAWVDQLERPASPGLGLRKLTGGAGKWPADKAESLIQQVQTGSVSVEIYFLGGVDMA